jgi:protein-S-isoprenylcysteine O-methyltransferase Ste14
MSGLPALALMAIWIAFGLGFATRPRGTGGSATLKRSPRSFFGIGLQGVGMFLAWSGMTRRDARPVANALALAGLGIGLASAALAFLAARHLGRQWALQARLIEGHQLVTSGPYAFVRHPIYSAMLGMLIATGLLTGAVLPAAVGVLPFLAGTWIRTHEEEGLLRGQFGEAFEAYRRRTGWLVPFVG